MRQKKIKLHELPHTEMVKLGIQYQRYILKKKSLFWNYFSLLHQTKPAKTGYSEFEWTAVAFNV